MFITRFQSFLFSLQFTVLTYVRSWFVVVLALQFSVSLYSFHSCSVLVELFTIARSWAAFFSVLSLLC